jgi:hypothetical protein
MGLLSKAPWLFTCTVLISLLQMGCGSSSVTMNIKSLSAGTTSTSLNLMDSLETMNFLRPGSHFSAAVSVSGTDYGSAGVGTGGLESFKLYIKEIRFCNSITTSGTAYNNPSGCATIYKNDTDNYDSFDVTAAASASTGKYYDILSATDRASLTTTASIAAGEYNYGIIDWYRPVKIKATLPRTHGDLKTTGCASYSTMNSNNTCIQSNFTGTLAESTVDLNNGGTWFKFLKPFTATGTSANVDLAFDLENRIFGGQDVSNGAVQTTSVCAGSGGTSCGMAIPLLKLVPVPRNSTESTLVETYEMAGTSAEWKLRVDVYYNSADTGKAVLAADIFPIPTSSIASSIAAGVYVTSVETSGTTTNFKNYDGTTTLSFDRGASGTGTLTCPSGATLAGCTAGSTMSVTWSSRTIRSL